MKPLARQLEIPFPPRLWVNIDALPPISVEKMIWYAESIGIMFYHKEEDYMQTQPPITAIVDRTQKVLQIAHMCHQTNKAWCELNGDFSQKDWNDAPMPLRESAVTGVNFRLDNPEATPEAQHGAWMSHKFEEGWIWGPVKDQTKKTHPCLVPYDELPERDRIKDALFCAIVDILK